MADTAAPPAPAGTGGPFGRPYDCIFVDGRFTPSEDARVSAHANALSYGTGTFEGIRACWSSDLQELFLLEAEAHYARMQRSAHILGLTLPYLPAELVDLTAELLRRNEVRSDAYVRPLLLLAGEDLPVRMHDIEQRFSIAATPIPGDYIPAQGVRCAVSSWRRCPDTAVPVRAKVVGSYAGPALAKTEAARSGYDEAIMLSLGGYVAEATTSNIFVRFEDSWITPPVTDDILEGITREQVMTLIGEDLDAPVIQRSIHRSELYICDEALLCGTAAIVAPVVEVDGRQVGDGAPGKATATLNHNLRAIARRTDDRHPEWTTPVYADKETP